MRTTIDAAGRVVIPKAMRERLGLRGSEKIEIDEVDGRIEISRPPRTGGLVRGSHGLLVFESDSESEPIESRDVRTAIEQSRAYPR